MRRLSRRRWRRPSPPPLNPIAAEPLPPPKRHRPRPMHRVRPAWPRRRMAKRRVCPARASGSRWSSYANVRSAPSSTAETIRMAEKGAKLRVTGRKGNWVQVTDPATSEAGWVYSRYHRGNG